MHLQQYLYTPYYCEENIYRLCETLTGIQGYCKELYVVFISNDEKKVQSCWWRHIVTRRVKRNVYTVMLADQRYSWDLPSFVACRSPSWPRICQRTREGQLCGTIM